MKTCICERLSFDTLFRISDPKRVYRSFSVKGPPLEIDAYQDAVYHTFNFKSYPSTTGLRHRGYIKFFKPKTGKNTPLSKVDCLVDCECPDFRYRWAWANKQRGSSVVGASSLNQAHNRAPRVTNPSGKPGLCKHILAARDYIYGLLAQFPDEGKDTAAALDKLTKHATTRWANYDAQMTAAREREAKYKAGAQARNRGEVPPATAPVRPGELATSVNARTADPKGDEEKSTSALQRLKPPPLPKMSTKKPPAAAKPLAPAKPPAPIAPGAKPKTKPVAAKPAGSPLSQLGGKQEKPFASIMRRFLKTESVVTANNVEFMNDLKEALKLVEELEQDELDALGAGAGTDAIAAGEGEGAGPEMDTFGELGAPGGETLEPSEPPVSDSAIGADTEGDTALGLLRQIATGIQQMATVIAPPEEAPGGDGMEGPAGEGEGAPLPMDGDMPPEPPTDEEEGELGIESPEHEGEESPDEEKAEHKPKKDKKGEE